MALSTPHTFFILDRMEHFNGGPLTDIFRNSFNYTLLLQEGLSKASSYLREANPTKVLFTSTPHDIEAWLFFQAAHHQGKKVFVICSSTLPWRGMIKQIAPDNRLGYRVIRYLHQEPKQKSADLSSKAKNFIKKKTGDYVTAEPGYMQKQRKIKKKIYKRVVSHFQRNFGSSSQKGLIRPSYIDLLILKYIKRIRKTRLKRAIRRCTVSGVPDQNCITFFLHYQPERTSIPEGGQYSQQAFAINVIANALPQGWSLIIKEHPSLFLLSNAYTFRHPAFYDWIMKQPNIYFVGTSYSSFDLIDQSRAVATLTGTVGFEAICRKTPVIALGDANYKEYPGVIDLGGAKFPSYSLEFLIEQANEQLKDSNKLLAKVAKDEQQSFWAGDERETLSQSTMTQMVDFVTKLGYLAKHI